MIKDSALAKQLTNKEIQKLREFMMFYMDSTDEEGEVDLGKIINNAAYNMGEAAVQIAGVIYQEKLKLDNMENLVKKARKAALEKLKESKMGWIPNAKETDIMVEGEDNVIQLSHDLVKQKLYIEFLTQCQVKIREYPMAAASLVKVASYGKEIGKIL